MATQAKTRQSRRGTTVVAPRSGDGQRICLALTGGDVAAASSALDLTKQLGGSLRAYFVAESPDPYAFIGFAGPGTESTVLALDMLRTVNSDRENAAREAFLHAAQQHGVTPGATGPDAIRLDWEGRLSDVASLAKAVELADFVVASKPKSRSDQGMAVFDAILYRARRSVLLIPEQASGLKIDHVMIAYNGSAEAARAATASLPILRHASVVTVVVIDPKDAVCRQAEDLVDYLRTHDVTAGLLESLSHGGTVESRLERTIAGEKPSLLVMGAYTHSQLRQSILGGLTSYMLDHATLPVLFAH